MRGELIAIAGAARRDAGDDAREAALRREIAATGLRSLPANVIDDLLPELEAARRGGWRFGVAAIAAAGIGAAIAVGFAHAHAVPAGIIAGVLGGLLAVACAWQAWRRASTASRARAAASRVALDAGIEPSELARLQDRLPVLRMLHEALDDAGGARPAGAQMQRRSRQRSDRFSIVPLPSRPKPASTHRSRGGDATTDAVIGNAQRILDRVDAVVIQAHRRDELVSEDAVLAAEESACAQSREDVDRAERAVANLEIRLRTTLKAGGITIADADPADAVAGVHHASERRRSHDLARRRLDEVQRSILALGGDARTLEHLETALAEQLIQCGGDPDTAITASPPDAAELQALDLEAERARRAATSAGDQARELRARLGGVLDTLPVIADLEDERDACETRTRPWTAPTDSAASRDGADRGGVTGDPPRDRSAARRVRSAAGSAC